MLAGRNMYRTRGIITRGLYISNPLFKWSKRVFYGAFFVKFCRYVLLVFKSGLKSRAGYNGARTVYIFHIISYLFQS